MNQCPKCKSDEGEFMIEGEIDMTELKSIVSHQYEVIIKLFQEVESHRVQLDYLTTEILKHRLIEFEKPRLTINELKQEIDNLSGKTTYLYTKSQEVARKKEAKSAF